MTIMQLLYALVGALFWGSLNAFFAQRDRRPQRPWFLIGFLSSLGGAFLFSGFFFGVLSVVFYILYPGLFSYYRARRPLKKPQAKPQAPAKRGEKWLKHWYYLDSRHQQQGPMEFPDLIENFRKKQVLDDSYVWGEGMKEWKQLQELPEVKEELKQAEKLLSSKK